MKHTGKRDLTRWLFVLPAIIVVCALFLYPICSSVFYSFTNKNLIRPTYSFVGFDNYVTILTDKAFWNSFFNSLKWTIFSLAGQLLVGFTAALALNRVKHLKGVYKTLLIIPWAFPSIVIAFSWKWILNGNRLQCRQHINHNHGCTKPYVYQNQHHKCQCFFC